MSHTIQAFAFDGDASDSANFRSNNFADNPVTRGQIAVFLSRALCLQFAP